MKRKCKNIDITDIDTISPYVRKCIMMHNHYKRNDFERVLKKHGMSKQDYDNFCITKNMDLLDVPLRNICEEIIEHIKNRDISYLPKVCIEEKIDKASGKVRLIGKESPMQQMYDYVAVYSCQEIWNKRYVKEQASSLPRRGQIYGRNKIKSWIDKDNNALAYAVKHNIRYQRKCVYHVKLDITKCYPSCRTDKFMALFKKDCANEDILWLYESLLESHKVDNYLGFMIGALVSMFACQYMLSFGYRYVKSKHFKNRKVVHHMLLFMDDQLMIASNKTALKRVVIDYIEYTYNTFGLSIKPNWKIHKFSDVPIDMMGYVFYQNGKIAIRDRDFVKTRRMLIRGSNGLSYRQAQRLNSYKGFYKYSNNKKIKSKYRAKRIFKLARKIVSRKDKKCYLKNVCQQN